MKTFLPYVRELEWKLSKRESVSSEDWKSWCDLCLDGGPAHELRGAVKLADRQAHGVFFTDYRLGRRAVLTLGVPTTEKSVFLDPTCGAGDLLLAVAKRLPLVGSVADTLALWEENLAGCEISSEFVRATKARLALLAMHRCGSRERIGHEELFNMFPMIVEGDALNSQELYAKANRLIMNPPFCAINAPDDCKWARGSINSASFFMETAIRNTTEGTRIVAILPDVLRSGSRYSQWRGMISKNANIESVIPYGPFDQYANIDVFLLCLTVNKNEPHPLQIQWIHIKNEERKTVAQHFEVHVGTVIPHRHKEIGTKYRYIHARSLPPWKTKHRIREKRYFEGNVFKPPFVAIRRTSSPSDNKRAVATIVLGKGDVAVENHLIVCSPLHGSIESCYDLMDRLQSDKTDQWLNQRIRCRHLTVSVVRDIPWWENP